LPLIAIYSCLCGYVNYGKQKIVKKAINRTVPGTGCRLVPFFMMEKLGRTNRRDVLQEAKK